MDDRGPLAAITDLTDAINGMSERLDKAEKAERMTLGLIAAAIVLILAVGAGLGIWIGLEASARESANRAQEAAQITQAGRNQQAIARLAYNNCVNGNRARAEDLKFEELFIPAVLAGTPDAKATAARLLAIVRVKDAQRQCTPSAGP